jgi:hypothetical protein
MQEVDFGGESLSAQTDRDPQSSHGRISGEMALTTRQRTRELVVALAVFSGLAFAVTAPVWLGRGSLRPERWFDFDPLYRLDLNTLQLPEKTDFSSVVLDLPRDLTVARHFHAGRLAHWNPLSGCGAPLWAEQGGPFFPLKLPLYLAPSLFTYDLFLTLRLVAAGLGAYLLARSRGLSLLAALTAGAVFELCGTMLENIAYASTSALCVLPWAALGAAAIAGRPGGRSCAGAALALGVAGSGGHPAFVLIVYAAFCVAVAGHALGAGRAPRRALAIVGWGALAVVLGAAFAAPTLLPLAELASVGASYKFTALGDEIRLNALRTSRNTMPIALFAPHVLAAMRDALFANHVTDVTVGVGALVLAVAGILRGGLDGGLWGIAALGLVITTAPTGLAWLSELPGLRIVLPYYAGGLIALPLAQAAGAGIEALRDRHGARVVLVAPLLVLAGMACLLLVENVGEKALTLTVRRTLDGALATTDGRIRLAAPLLAAATGVGVWRALQGTRFARGAAVAVAAIAIGDLMALWAAFLPFERSPALRAGPSPAVRHLRARMVDGARFTGSPNLVGHGLTPMLYGLRDVRNVSALPVGRYAAYALAYYRGYSVTLQEFPLIPRPALLDLAAVRNLALQDRSENFLEQTGRPTYDPSMLVEYEAPRLVIYENRAALPRARIVHGADRLADEARARAAIEWIGRQPRHAAALKLDDHVILEPDETGAFPPPLDRRVLPGEWVRIVDESDPDRLVLEARLATPGLVTVADTYYPGWRATIDGAPTPIYPANLAFRAVYVPAGEHTIVFRYEPRAFWYGCLAAFAACVVCVALALGRRRAPRDGEG